MYNLKSLIWKKKTRVNYVEIFTYIVHVYLFKVSNNICTNNIQMQGSLSHTCKYGIRGLIDRLS